MNGKNMREEMEMMDNGETTDRETLRAYLHGDRESALELMPMPVDVYVRRIGGGR